MATIASEDVGLNNGSTEGLSDPFVTSSSGDGEQRRASHRYSAFDTQLFSHYQPSSSPSQAKKALEAHLTETDKRLEEASKLGTALVQQRKELADHLKDVEARQGEQEIGPELRQKLVEIEKEYNELGRDSARTFLPPKRESTGNVLTEIRNPASPTKFSTQATDSPSKVSVPSRKQRNQPTNRVHDIEFATEISTSLLAQVRQLQGVVAERDDALKKLTQERSELEIGHQSLQQRVKNLDESEQRYKDENWSLETQTHEMMAAAKEAAVREQKLQQSLALTTNEKSAAQRDLDDIKQSHGKLTEEYTAFRKTHDADFAGLKKSATFADADRDTLQRRVDELTSQNQELARAVAGRFKGDEADQLVDAPIEPDDFSLDRSEAEHSPPPSPSKGGARSGALESETLKSSLTHAHRMIQTLKTNIHKEKSERMELKRQLQESRDELEIRRVEGGSSSKRAKTKSQTELSKKSSKISHLGAGRNSRTEIQMDDADWEDHQGEERPKRISTLAAEMAAKPSEGSDAYMTANETEDAFETADERGTTESEAFETGAEEQGGDSSDQLTETEDTTNKESVKAARPPPLTTDKRASYISTASTTDADSDNDTKTPAQSTFSRLKNRLSRGSRRSRYSLEGTPDSFRDSPASTASGRTPKGQSLAAELGDFDQDLDDEDVGTPSRRTTLSRRSTPGRSVVTQVNEPPVPKLPMSDMGVMTDPWEPTSTVAEAEPITAPTSPVVAAPVQMADAAVQGHPAAELEDSKSVGAVATEPAPIERHPALGFSEIQSLASEAPANVDTDVSAVVGADTSGTKDNNTLEEAASAGVIGSMLGWAIGKRQSTPQPITEDAAKSPDDTPATVDKRTPFAELSPNTMSRKQDSLAKTVDTSDQGAQTTLSAEQIDSLLKKKDRAVLAPISPTAANSTETNNTVAGPKPVLSREIMPPSRSTKRPGSSSSVRTAQLDAPPLPPDHRQAIAAAAQNPVARASSEGTMGPPGMPASAYKSASKRPQTPTEQNVYNPHRASMTPTTPRGNRYSTNRSMRSRRSSVSSFESELDARFNIRPDGVPVAATMEGGTDPRMIQAITQTMIGEYLWKYTRKAGRGQMSANRHRRFFWVHPYTRTLYWSDQDPSTAGRAQLKAKSVAIDAVRVVGDDNHMPPGLHRKSLIIITPGRDVKLTATTGQRHETWFNALSYLLLRSGPDPMFASAAAGAGNDLTAADVAEFNPGSAAAGAAGAYGTASSAGYGTVVPRHSTNSRTSLSTYNSRTNTTRNSRLSSRNQSPERQGTVRRTPQGTAQLPTQIQGSLASRTSKANSASLGSRLSSYWRPGRSSVGLQHAGASGEGENGAAGIYDARRVANDSAEDVRAVLAKQDDEADQLENVRACCDGKHDVGSLNRHSTLGGRMSARHSHAH